MGHYTVYTIGHGEQDWDSVARQLRAYGVELLVDARAYPYVTGAHHFDRDRLEHLARREGIEYVWLGSNLGALTADGRVDYIAKEREPRYREGINELLGLAHDRCVCVLASQADPELSHRHHLIAQTLIRCDVEVRHILPGGSDVLAQADLFHVGR
jgi:uncharacterized protein (DUF488 family)